MKDDYVPIETAANELNVSRTAIYTWHKKARITLYKKAGKTYMLRSEIDKIKTEKEDFRPLER
jgi:predicted site-specific integrase-resolvase